MSAMSGGLTITKRYTSVDASTGQEISFSSPINGFMITVEAGGEAYYEGSLSGKNSGLYHFKGSLSIPIGGPSDRTYGTIYAATGTTIDVSLIAWR